MTTNDPYFAKVDHSEKCSENPTENGGSERAINCREPNETGAFMGIARNAWGPEMLGAQTRKTLINTGLQNTKHGKHAS